MSALRSASNSYDSLVLWPTGWTKRASPSLGGAHNIRDFAVGISGAIAMRSHCNGNGVKRSANKGRGSLANEVLEYLINHERAHDTVEGIVAWWLPVQRIEYAITEVEVALRELAAGKFVIARKAPDGRLHYRMNPKKKEAIRRRLVMKTAKNATLPSKVRKHN